MAVISVKERFRCPVTVDENGTVSPFEYQIVVDNDTTRPIDLLGATDGTRTLPSYGDELGSTGLFCKSLMIDYERTSSPWSPRIFKATGHYAPPKPFGAGAAPEDGATKFNIQVRGGGSEYTYMCGVDTAGNPLWVTDAGETHETFSDIPVTKYDEVITVSYDIGTAGFAAEATAIRACRGRLNDADVTFSINGYSETFPAGTLLCGNASWEASISNGGDPTYHIEIPLMFRSQKDSEDTEKGWAFQVPAQGKIYIDSNSKLAVSQDGQEHKLTYNGHLLFAGGPVHMRWFDLIERVSFTDLLSGV